MINWCISSSYLLLFWWSKHHDYLGRHNDHTVYIHAWYIIYTVIYYTVMMFTVDCIAGSITVLFCYRQGFITQDESTVLNELYNYSPLLFDFACKMLVTGLGGERFPSRVFRAHSLLPPFRHDSNLLCTPV